MHKPEAQDTTRTQAPSASAVYAIVCDFLAGNNKSNTNGSTHFVENVPLGFLNIVCDFITAQAQANTTEGSGEWEDYRKVFLSAEVQDLICARLPGAAAEAAGPGGTAKSSIDGLRSSKKRKCDGAQDASDGAPTPVTWTVCCLDGATFSADVPEDARVVEMKRVIGRLREVPPRAFELFVKDEEEPLDDEKRLCSAEKVPLFMLQKEVSDRLALEALFRSAGGADWHKKDGWMTEAGLGELTGESRWMQRAG